MTSEHLPWQDGLPTRPEVDALLNAFPPAQLRVGTEISDAQIRAVMGTADSVRFRTVTNVWRRRLLSDHGIALFRAKSTGFFVPSPDQITARTHPTLRHVTHTVTSQIKNLSSVKADTQTQRDTVDHHGRLLGHIKLEAKKARMNVLPPAASQPMPRIRGDNRH